jgi:hypothetical protein
VEVLVIQQAGQELLRKVIPAETVMEHLEHMAVVEAVVLPALVLLLQAVAAALEVVAQRPR